VARLRGRVARSQRSGKRRRRLVGAFLFSVVSYSDQSLLRCFHYTRNFAALRRATPGASERVGQMFLSLRQFLQQLIALQTSSAAFNRWYTRDHTSVVQVLDAPSRSQVRLSHSGCWSIATSTGSFRRRLPVAAKIALVTAGTMSEVPASPMPPGDSWLGTICTSTSGASFIRRIW
jgi:hypothetical protein